MVMVEGRRMRKVIEKAVRHGLCGLHGYAYTYLTPLVCLCAIILRRLVRLITWLGIRGTGSEEIAMQNEHSIDESTRTAR
jgi:hypothetical protein